MGIRLVWDQETVGSNPTTLIDVMRWVLCWYGKATVNRPDAGSIPATAALSGSLSLVILHWSFNRALGRAAKVPAFQAGQAGSIPAGHSS